MNEKIITAVGILFDMDKFVMDVYDNESWLTYGVPDGEFEEDTRADAEANYTEHDWLITDGDEFVCEDFQDFIDAFKGATRNSRDYDRVQRDSIVKEAEDFLAGNCGQKVSTSDSVDESKHLSNEQLRQYVENRKRSMNESLLLEASAKSIVKDAKNMKKSGHLYFIKKGDQAHKKCTFDEFKDWTDEELLNATVVDKQGYYVRRGAVKASGHERRQGPGTDFLSDEKGEKKNKKANAQLKKVADKKAANSAPKGDYRKFTYVIKGKPLTFDQAKAQLDALGNTPDEKALKKLQLHIRDEKNNEISYADFRNAQKAQGAKQAQKDAKVQGKQADAKKAKMVKKDTKTKNTTLKDDAKQVKKYIKFHPIRKSGKLDTTVELNYAQWRKLYKQDRAAAMKYMGIFGTGDDAVKMTIDQWRDTGSGKLFESIEMDDFDAFSLNESYALAKSMDYDDDVEVGYDVEYDDDFNIDDTFG